MYTIILLCTNAVNKWNSAICRLNAPPVVPLVVVLLPTDKGRPTF